MIPRIALTPGEPAGIGPDLVVQLVQQAQQAELVAIADTHMLRERAAMLGLPLKTKPYGPNRSATAATPGTLRVLQVPLTAPANCGQLNPANAEYVLQTLRIATRLCLSGEAAGLVTGPVHKGVINEAGISFTGHTEFLAESSGGHHPVMMLATPSLRVALVTTHLPLSQVSHAITRDRISRVVRILDRDLHRLFGIESPHILVCGLNPHAGEGGHLGREEIETIAPVLEQLRSEGMHLSGPLPADTAFTPPMLQTGDAVLAMYHDQGLPVLKHAGFGQAVNVTLGLPIIRTSVDHGTALELAGTGRAAAGSLQAAVDMAVDLAARCQD